MHLFYVSFSFWDAEWRINLLEVCGPCDRRKGVKVIFQDTCTYFCAKGIHSEGREENNMYSIQKIHQLL